MYIYNLQVSNKKGLYSYSFDKKLEIGSVCIVDFRNKLDIAVVISDITDKELPFSKDLIKEIIEVIDLKIDNSMMQLIKWVKSYYISEYNLIVPSVLGINYEDINTYYNLKQKIENEEKIEEDLTYLNDNILNDIQEKAYQQILNSDKKNFLIYGITGSGKTEVYIKLISSCIKNGESAILLVPEIALTTQMIKRFSSVYKDKMIVIHSKLTKKKRIEAMLKLKKGEYKLVIGTRSALFSQVKNLGIIIIDEEHESTYKQDDNLVYNARTVAIKRAMIENCKVVLASATPSFEAFYYADNNLFERIDMLYRYNDSSLPSYKVREISDIEDMLDDTIFSLISEKISKNEQVIVILNRKAYSVLAKCKKCEEIKMCPNCSTKLNYLKSKNILRCIHCNYSEQFNKHCSCGGEYELKGIGTEKVEEILFKYFGEDILRMDNDTMTTTKKLEEAYTKFKNKEKMILIGTQMVAKGFHFPDVTLVIVVNADQSLNIPDFRNSEKSFQLITQASGRAGRGDKKGEVLIQTFDEGSDFINNIIKNDYYSFYSNQIKYREMFFLPPISKLIKLSTVNSNESICLNEAYAILRKLHELSKKENFSDNLNISQVEKSPLFKVKNKYKYNIFIYLEKKDYEIMKKIIRSIKNDKSIKSKIYIDVEPMNLI